LAEQRPERAGRSHAQLLPDLRRGVLEGLGACHRHVRPAGARRREHPCGAREARLQRLEDAPGRELLGGLLDGLSALAELVAVADRGLGELLELLLRALDLARQRHGYAPTTT